MALFHLGRPLFAFRAVLGLRTSWLSREIVAFGGFVAATAGCAAAGFADLPGIERALGPLAAALGLGAVGCSVMVYAATRRPCWTAPRTAAAFFGSALVSGLALAMVTATAQAARAAEPLSGTARSLVWALAAAMLAKLAWEAAQLLSAADRRHTPARRRADLLLGPLRPILRARLALAAAPAALVPIHADLLHAPATAGDVVLSLVIAALALAGEILERHLFFVAAPARRMPGEAP